LVLNINQSIILTIKPPEVNMLSLVKHILFANKNRQKGLDTS
jgi:hypothetical protein